MNHFSAISLFSLLLTTAVASANDWPSWRGPAHNGVAEKQNAPIQLGEPKWSTEVPGRSHGSLSVAGRQVVFAIADKNGQSVACADRKTGKLLWTTRVHEGGLTQRLNKKATWASSTPAIHGGRIFINFVNGKSAYTTALDLDGKQLWQTELCPYKIHQGYASSPAIFEDLVIVSADNKLGGALCGIRQESGTIAWKVKRASQPNYPSPVIFTVGGKTQLFLTGTDKVSSFDPATGDVIWQIEGATTECVTTTVTDGTAHLFDGRISPESRCRHRGRWIRNRMERPHPGLCSLALYKDGHLFGVMDAGVAVCWKSDTGEEVWKGRLGGTFSSSPVLVGDHIYAANESGTLFVFEADPAKLTVLAKNQIADEIFATPAICGGEIYLRVAFYQGEKRTEKIVCYAN